MFDQANKLNVFISSACGEGKEKYNLVRAGLKVILESTPFVRKVYLFEEEGASTLPTGQHYSSSLEESDVCIFLIDNFDGIPDGVLKEVQIANKYSIKSFYYFCDQTSKEQTQLQTNLQGTQHEKYCTVHSFEDILKKGAVDLLADLLRVYKVYCKGLMKFEQDDGASSNLQIARSYFQESLVAEKETISNIDKCKLYFYNLLLPKFDPHEIKSTSILDDICREFLPYLFECSQIKDATIQALIAEIKKRQEPDHFSVTCKRLEAIKCYFRGNTESCLLMLQDALDFAKASHLPAWLINDILIDLRNQQSIIDDEKNIISFDSVFQQELNTNREVLFYPLLDRFGRECYELIIEDEIEQRIKSPRTITYGTKIKQYTDFLAAQYTVALYNGSITHLRRIYDEIKFIAFFYAERHTTWNFKLALIKMLVVDYSIKELSQVKVHFSDILGKLNARDAIEIYNFANNNHVGYQCFSSKLTAFSLVGYYLDDAQFQSVWNDLYSRILSWCQSPTAVISLGNHIFKSVYENRYRINQTQIVEIVLACFRNNLRRFYDDAISLTYHLEIKYLPDSYVTELITLLLNLTVDDEERTHINGLEEALIHFRVQNRELTNELDEAIREKMYSFYKKDYTLDTIEQSSSDISGFIEQYVEESKRRNKEQGAQGVYHGYGYSPFIYIDKMLRQAPSLLKESISHEVYFAACETVLNDKQTISEKIAAVDIMIYLVCNVPSISSQYVELNTRIQHETEHVLLGHSMLTNLDKQHLFIHVLFLYSCFKQDISIKLIEILAENQEDVLFVLEACKVVDLFIEESKPYLSESLEHIILQNAIRWCNMTNSDIRWYSISVLFKLLVNPQHAGIITKQIVHMMDVDDMHVKISILRRSGLLLTHDKSTYEYILQKARVDPNYLVRKVGQEILAE